MQNYQELIEWLWLVIPENWSTLPIKKLENIYEYAWPRIPFFFSFFCRGSFIFHILPVLSFILSFCLLFFSYILIFLRIPSTNFTVGYLFFKPRKHWDIFISFGNLFYSSSFLSVNRIHLLLFSFGLSIIGSKDHVKLSEFFYWINLGLT